MENNKDNNLYLEENQIISLSKIENFYDKEKGKNLFYDENKQLFVKLDKTLLTVFTINKIKHQINFESNEEIKNACFNQNEELLCLTSKEIIYIINFKKQNISKINSFSNVLFSFFLGSEKKEKNLLFILTNKLYNLSIIDFSNEKIVQKFFYQNPFNSKDFLFNLKYKILILRKENSINIINLKNEKTMLKPFLDIKISFSENDKFYLQELYNKLYLIIVNNFNIDIYKLKKLNEIKKKTTLSISEENIQIQYFDNLIICYLINYIQIYDIKIKTEQLIAKYKYNSFLKNDIFFYNNNIIRINNDYYETNINLGILENIFKNNNSINSSELFFCLFRRKNKKNEYINYCIYLIENNKFKSIIEIIKTNFKKYKKYKNYKFEENKLENYLKSYPKEFDYVNQIDFYQILNSEMNIETEKILKILTLLVNLYQENNIEIDMEILIPIIITRLNNMKNLSYLDNLIKSKLLPYDINLAFYFIDRYNMIGNKFEKEFSLNLGISILLQFNSNIEFKKPLIELIKEQKYIEVINLIHEKFLQDKKFKKDEKNLKQFFYNQISNIFQLNNSKLNFVELVKKNN